MSVVLDTNKLIANEKKLYTKTKTSIRIENEPKENEHRFNSSFCSHLRSAQSSGFEDSVARYGAELSTESNKTRY